MSEYFVFGLLVPKHSFVSFNVVAGGGEAVDLYKVCWRHFNHFSYRYTLLVVPVD